MTKSKVGDTGEAGQSSVQVDSTPLQYIKVVGTYQNNPSVEEAKHMNLCGLAVHFRLAGELRVVLGHLEYQESVDPRTTHPRRTIVMTQVDQVMRLEHVVVAKSMTSKISHSLLPEQKSVS